MSVARKSFCTATIRLAGGCFLPRKYGTSGCIPALVKSTLASSFKVSGQLGSLVWPFASKNLMNRSRISALSIDPCSLRLTPTRFAACGCSACGAEYRRPSPAKPGFACTLPRSPLRAKKTTRGDHTVSSPRSPVLSRSLTSGLAGGTAFTAATGALARALTHTGALPLPLGFVDQLPSLDLRLLRKVVRDLLQLVGAALQLLAAHAKLLARQIAGLRCVQERDDGAGEQPDEESHGTSPCFFSLLMTLARVSRLGDAYGECRERGGHRREEQLSVPQHAQPRPGDLSGRLRQRDRRGGEDPGGAESMRTTERGAQSGGDAERQECQGDQSRWH